LDQSQCADCNSAIAGHRSKRLPQSLDGMDSRRRGASAPRNQKPDQSRKRLQERDRRVLSSEGQARFVRLALCPTQCHFCQTTPETVQPRLSNLRHVNVQRVAARRALNSMWAQYRRRAAYNRQEHHRRKRECKPLSAGRQRGGARLTSEFRRERIFLAPPIVFTSVAAAGGDCFSSGSIRFEPNRHRL